MQRRNFLKAVALATALGPGELPKVPLSSRETWTWERSIGWRERPCLTNSGEWVLVRYEYLGYMESKGVSSKGRKVTLVELGPVCHSGRIDLEDLENRITSRERILEEK